MRCQEARRLMNETDEIGRQLAQHLNSCASCGRLARARGILKQSVDTVRSQSADDSTPFQFLKTRLQTRAASQNRQESSIMTNLKNNLVRHPKLTVGLVAAVVAFAVISLVPFSYSVTTGYSVNFQLQGTELAVAPPVLNKALAALGYEQAQLNFDMNREGLQVRIDDLPSYDAARETAAAFAELSGSDAEPVIEPIRHQVSGSLYAQVGDRLTEINIARGDRSDEEIAAEITARLAEHGISADVRVQTDVDGQMQIDVSMSSDKSGSAAIFLDENGQVEVLTDEDGKTYWLDDEGNRHEVDLQKIK
jgi:hypothetical protein